MSENETAIEPAIPAVRKLGLFVLFLIVAMVFTLVLMEYRTGRSTALVRAHTAAHVVATQFEWIFEASAQALQRIERAVLEQGVRVENNGIVDINQTVQNLPGNYHYSVYTANGDLTYTSIQNEQRINIAERSYFRELAEGTEIVISPAIRAEQDGRDIFLIARRLDRDDQFVGVATVAVPSDVIRNLAASLGLDGHSIISLLRLDGMIVARSPAAPMLDVSDARVLEALKKEPNGSYSTTSPVDGVPRLVGYWRVGSWPVVAIAAIDESAVIRNFWRVVGIWLILATPVLFALIYVVGRLYRVLSIDERRQAALKIAHDRNEYLLREIHHRVKNNLQTVMSLVRLQKMAPEDKQSLLGRIASMVAVHEEMYTTDKFESVEVGSYLRRLVDEIAQAFGRDVAVSFNADSIRLSGDRAMQLGLLFNELVSNAFKHAWTTEAEGKLAVSLTQLPDGMVELVVADDGIGLLPDNIQSMGSRLIEAFTAQLGGQVTSISEGGTRVAVRFPLEAEQVSA